MNIGDSLVKKTISKEREERLARLKDPNTGKVFLIPLHQGLILGPIPGLISIKNTLAKITKGGATGVILHKGIIHNIYRRQKRELAVIMHLSASTVLGPDQNHKILVGNVVEAIKLGASAVSLHINLGADTEPEMLRDFGKISTECNLYKVPLIAMIYPCGPLIENPFDVELIKHAARVGAELGADIVVTSFTGNIESFHEVVQGCPVPILASDGPKMNLDLEILKFVNDSILAGAAGVAIGINVFQHKKILGITKAISKILFNNEDVEKVYRELMENKI